MVDELERLQHALTRIEGGKVKALSDGDRVYLMIQDAPMELRRLADALEKLNISDLKALVIYGDPRRNQVDANPAQTLTPDGPEVEIPPPADAPRSEEP